MTPSPLRWETKFLSRTEFYILMRKGKMMPYTIYQVYKNEKLTYV